MKRRLVAAAVMGLAMSSTIAATDASTTATSATTSTSLNTEMDKLSYSIGADLGKKFKEQGIDITPAAMAKGLQDGMNGNKYQLTDEQMRDVLNTFQKNLMAKRTTDFNKKAEENKTKGETFLNQNKTKEGVVSLPSGLQYKILQKGDGATPSKEDTVTVDYTGTLIDGQVFDTTEKTGKPATFKVSQVIPGWTEALQLMPSGSTWEVYVPSDLAYGPRAVGGPIGPNETLIFKIHLISVKKAEA